MNVSYQDMNIPYQDVNVSYQDMNVSYPDMNISYPDMNISYQDINISYQDMNISFQDMNTSYYDVRAFDIADWGFWVKFVATPVLVLVGIIGNILSVVVMSTKSLRKKSYSIYLCTLAIFDTGTLVFTQLALVDEYLVAHKKLPGVFHDFNDIGCKFYNFLSHVMTLMSAWLVVLMAMERLMAVCFPFKNTPFRKQNGAAIVIGVLLALVLISQSFRLVMIDHMIYDPVYNIWDCLAGTDYINIYTSLDVYFFQWALLFVLPVFLILVCNSLVICRIFKIKRELHKKEKDLDNRHKRSWNKKNRSTFMLLTVTFTYILSLLPLFTLSLIVDLTIKLGDINAAIATYFGLTPYLDLCVPISILNYAVNFFIYVLSGKRFRNELLGRFGRERHSISRSSSGSGRRSQRKELLPK